MFDSLFKKQPAYILRPEWKEMLWYIEGENRFCFDCGWGVTPGVTYVPSPEDWDACVPPFMRGRREEIVKRVAGLENSVVEVGRYSPYNGR